MRSLTTTVSSVSIAAASVVGLMSAAIAPAAAQQPGAQAPRGWVKICGKEQDFDVCSVQREVIAQTGQLLTSVQLAEFTGKVNRKAMQVSVPIGRMLPAGITMQIDGSKPVKLEFTTCFQDRCVADAPFTDAIVASMKKGTELTLTSHNFQNQPNPIKVSLEGFTGAYDGEPLQQNDLAERKKAAEDYILKNQQKLAEQLKEAQEKAKAGN